MQKTNAITDAKDVKDGQWAKYLEFCQEKGREPKEFSNLQKFLGGAA